MLREKVGEEELGSTFRKIKAGNSADVKVRAFLRLWLAEGFLKENSTQEFKEDIAQIYFEELVNRTWFKYQNYVLTIAQEDAACLVPCTIICFRKLEKRKSLCEH